MSYRTNFTMDDDDDWQEMPVVRERSPASSPSSSDTEGAPSGYGRPGASIASASTSSFGSQQKRAQKKVGFGSTATATKASASSPAKSLRTNAAANAASATTASQRGHRRNLSSQTNATGRQLDIDDARGFSWRAKPAGLGEGGGRRRIDRLPEDKDADENEAAQGGRRRRLKPGDSSGSSSDDDNDDDDDEGGARGYTQLRLDDDVEGEEIDAATEYLFGQGHTAEDIASGEAPGATPHSQLDTTKNLLSEGQKIAYVGLVSLVARDLIRLLQRVPGKELKPAIDSADEWRLRVMARLFQHMDIESSEQSMIHSLAQHGVLPTDLAPSLVTTQTVDNPDFDPEAERERDEEREQQEQLDAERKEKEGQEKETTDEERGEGEVQEGEREEGERAREGPSHDKEKIESEEGEGADTGKAEKEALDETEAEEQRREESEGAATARLEGEAAGDLGDPFADEYAGGDLGSSGDADVKREIVETDAGQSLSADIANEEGSGDLGTDASTPTLAAGPSTPTIPDSKRVDPEEKDAFSAAAASAGSDRTEEKRSSRIIADPNTTTRVLGSATADDIVDKTTPMGLTNQPQTIDTLPSALEGVTTELSSADRKITLDLRWTVLCDLFLVLTADSVYDSRSRVLLEKVAEHLGLAWMDVTKFEKRVTDALEIEEGVAGSLRGKKAVKKRAEAARRRRLVMMGLATVGGGLVIGLSAGLMAPFIGAGLGAALGTIGVGGTTGFLGGVGGAAIITTTGTVGGAALGGRGMSRRTRSVKTFEFKPIHNNKRVNCIVTVGGFMSGPQDDPRLPFSVVDSIMGDVFSVLWEPEMMQEMGDAIYLLWNETIVQGLQQVLAATIAGGLVGALAWPLWLTKLGYFIDNPWSNALDRAHACGLILADVLSRRQLGVRPITLVGFSLGARAIFYCLVELAQKKKFGIVQNVYLMGAPVTASDKTWKEARAVVAGRFVNAFSRTDWILGYLFRATTGGLRSIAGLHPVERVPEVENIDVTQTVPGHLQYRAFMPLVLDELGFRTTADYFDEPEDLSKVPEREIVYEQEEPEAVKEMKAVKTSSGGFGQIFKRKKTADGQGTSSGSSSNNSSTDHGAGPSIKSPTSPAPPSKLATQVSGGDGDDDDDDLPPREEHSPSYPVEEPKTPTLSQPAVPNKPASNMPPQSGASSGDADLDAILAELRESGIEVKELQSSLPPLPLAKPTTPSGSQTPSKDVSVSTGKQSKEQQEASSSLEPPSTAATKANLPRMQNQQQAQTLSPSSPALDGPSTAGEDKQPSSRPRLPYAKSFGSTVFDVDELPPPPPYSSASFSDSQDVSLSFGSSYDDDYEDEQRTSKGSPPPRVIVNEEEEKDKGEAELERIASGSAYGLSEETARELARQFQSSGMSTQGARAAAKMAQTLGQGSSDYSPAAPTAASPALDPWSSGGAGAGDGEDEEAAASAVASSGFAPLSAPERSFSFGRQTDDEAFSSASAESRYGGKGRGGLDLQPQQDPWGAAPNSAYGSSSSSAAHTPATGGMESNPWG